MLSMTAIDKRYGGLHVLRKLSLDVVTGEILGVIGRNGAGKTTLFNVISGATRTDGGTIRLGDADITATAAHVRAQLGIARTFQIPQPLPTLSVRSNALVGALMRSRSAADAREFADEAIALVGLSQKVDVSASRLTLPELKRLEIARALAMGPRLLLLDEMMCGLRHEETTELLHLVRRVRMSGVTVLFIEHVMAAVMQLCDRVAVIDGGNVLTLATPQEVVRDERVITTYLGGALSA